MISINFIGVKYIPCNFSVDFVVLQAVSRPAKPLFGPKMTESWHIWTERRLKVNDLDCKCHWSLLLTHCMPKMTFLWIPMHIRASVDCWTFLLGPKKFKFLLFFFCQKLQLKVSNFDSKRFWSNLWMDCISLVPFLLIWLHSSKSLAMRTIVSDQKMSDNQVLCKNGG